MVCGASAGLVLPPPAQCGHEHLALGAGNLCRMFFPEALESSRPSGLAGVSDRRENR